MHNGTIVRLKASLILFVVGLAFSGCGGGGGNGLLSGGANPTPQARVTCSSSDPAQCDASASYGSAIASPSAIIQPPAVPPLLGAAEIVGLIVQNLDATPSAPRSLGFGQVFERGAVQATDALIAKGAAAAYLAQMDPLAYWPDGSVRLAAVTVALPGITGQSELPLRLAKASAADLKDFTTLTPVDLAAAVPSLTVTLDFTGGAHAGSRIIDLGAALNAALAAGGDYWLRGPLATQARVEMPVANGGAETATLRITADVTRFADGRYQADVQFNNDLTTILPRTGNKNPQAPLAPLSYTATLRLQGNVVSQTVSQPQYTAWHAVLDTAGSPAFNVRHDVAQLIRTGAVLPYDLGTGVNDALLQGFERDLIQAEGFGAPLAVNGVTTYMPTTGARPDIGYTTRYNTAWLLTQDARAAMVGLAQADTAGAIPWNHRLANGHWLTPGDHPMVWSDPRGGPQNATDGLAHQASIAPWQPDSAHMPDLTYVPYLMTGRRWNLDRLNAQAAFSLTYLIPSDTRRCRYRPGGQPTCDTLLDAGSQVRGQAWSFRQVLAAAFIGRPGSFEQGYFAQAVANNWAHVETLKPALAAAQGEATGWLPGDYGAPGVIAPWQQDFLTGVALLAARMGDDAARQFVAWQRDWLTGRFLGAGMNPHDGCAYNLSVGDAAGNSFNNWAAIEAATVAAGQSNGAGWADANYCAIARAALGGALTLNPRDAQLKAALDWLNASGAPSIDAASFRADPTFNLVPWP